MGTVVAVGCAESVLARILGITMSLDIPASSAVYSAVAGVVVCVVGIVLALPWRARAR